MRRLLTAKSGTVFMDAPGEDVFLFTNIKEAPNGVLKH